MFIDQEWKKQEKQPQKTREGAENKKSISLLGNVKKKKTDVYRGKGVFYAALVFSLSVVALLILFKPDLLNIRQIAHKNPPASGDSGQSSAVKGGGLPDIPDISGLDPLDIGSSTMNLRAEDLMFGHFYERADDDFRSTLESYALPINIKSDADNYYDISRKINLDPYIDDLNNNGFAILDNPFIKEANNFLGMYQFLLSKKIPTVITDDFIFYYFQNIWKLAYKEVEKNAFYDNLWKINKKMYDIALTRYKERREEVGMANDPVLEGERLETAFFATALKLLMPGDKQVNRNVNLADNTKFNPEEENLYYVQIPRYLEDSVNKEVGLIRDAKANVKSPIFLYTKNYKYFSVPDNYKNNAKLNNFYLTLKWFNSLFPLYYRSEECPDCSLDKNDWLINMAAAGFMAHDLSDNQDVANQWAIIYKFISFFSGLRGDLTYLNYDDVYRELYGDDYDIGKIYDRDNDNINADISVIQDKLSDFKFTAIEGGITRNDKTKPDVGMRLLQESYWPNDYIFSQFIGEDMTAAWDWEGGAWRRGNNTACRGETDKLPPYRCRASGVDLVDLFIPLAGDEYFDANADYRDYSVRAEALKGAIDQFDVFTWNNNIYWMTLDTASTLFGGSDIGPLPAYAGSDSWLVRKNVNTFLGGWVNLHLPEDTFVNYYEQETAGLDLFYADTRNYNYLEPSIDFVRELTARNTMLMKMLTALRVSDKTNVSTIDLRELNDLLVKLESIMERELSNNTLDENDNKFLADMITHYAVGKGGIKSFTLNFPFGGKREENIAGIKLVALIYENNGKKIIAVGPIFNYSEK